MTAVCFCNAVEEYFILRYLLRHQIIAEKKSYLTTYERFAKILHISQHRNEDPTKNSPQIQEISKQKSQQEFPRSHI